MLPGDHPAPNRRNLEIGAFHGRKAAICCFGVQVKRSASPRWHAGRRTSGSGIQWIHARWVRANSAGALALLYGTLACDREPLRSRPEPTCEVSVHPAARERPPEPHSCLACRHLRQAQRLCPATSARFPLRPRSRRMPVSCL